MEKQYKRQWRDFPEDAKRKVSDALKNRPKTDAHKQAISNSMRDYWKGVESKPEQTSMDDFLGVSD